MRRKEVLSKLGFEVPAKRRKRVIVHSDVANEADDPFAIIHHILTPSEDICGIIAGHNEYGSHFIPEIAKQYQMTADAFSAYLDSFGDEAILIPRGKSMERNYRAAERLLQLADITDIPLFHGSAYEIEDLKCLPESEGADFIVAEALKEDDRPLYIVLQGCLTDLAIAYKKEPKIAESLTAIWIGGGTYPEGNGGDFNLRQDLLAARIVMESNIPLWQIPCNVYASVEVTIPELVDQVKPCGVLGAYLVKLLIEQNTIRGNTYPGNWPHGEVWCLGDNPTVTVLLECPSRTDYHEQNAPKITDDLSYDGEIEDRKIRVYDSIDSRLTVQDLFSKLRLCYGGEN
ncbi:nucleoside hydrolase [Anaerobium acetethylicum]|uniref:Inosine-uridine preferring nucleoside hydrolase n=1 Tax=Anaerobium acetethylicum TaxID=1619234 RepID=A0A1D3TX41_9FIRM|nr:nucleoside hydrolase [Anaerobium acetethylicum]SCP98836.1 Inosine-uridine preferring nucleoside hydrolase [Anaerobium acetethylicum]